MFTKIFFRDDFSNFEGFLMLSIGRYSYLQEGAIALSYPSPPSSRVRVRAMVKLSATFFHDESSITKGRGGKGWGYESAIALKKITATPTLNSARIRIRTIYFSLYYIFLKNTTAIQLPEKMIMLIQHTEKKENSSSCKRYETS